MIWPPLSPVTFCYSRSGLFLTEGVFIPECDTPSRHQAGCDPAGPNTHKVTSLVSYTGFSVVANEAIEPDATIVTCPFSIVITPLLAKNALLPIILQPQLHDSSSGTQATMMERWTERQAIIIYVCFHWIASPEM
jgi:hypothetical protein